VNETKISVRNLKKVLTVRTANKKLHLTGTADSFREFWGDKKFGSFYLFGPMLFQSGEQIVMPNK
jgi:hypothetical protein